jgi:hypothetical protein
MSDRHLYLNELRKAFQTKQNRFDMKCPDCKRGCNSAGLGGNERCFHCGNCGLIECVITSPVLDENGSISE